MNTKKIKAWMKQHLDEVHDPKTDEYNCTLLTELAATEFDIEDTEQLEDMSLIAFDVVSEETMDEQEVYLDADDIDIDSFADILKGRVNFAIRVVKFDKGD